MPSNTICLEMKVDEKKTSLNYRRWICPLIQLLSNTDELYSFFIARNKKYISIYHKHYYIITRTKDWWIAAMFHQENQRWYFIKLVPISQSEIMQLSLQKVFPWFYVMKVDGNTCEMFSQYFIPKFYHSLPFIRT